MANRNFSTEIPLPPCDFVPKKYQVSTQIQAYYTLKISNFARCKEI